ncbi:hypothetical protein Cgig2_020126 [Carnegiea gigantea]|uniref:At3g05675-like ankyrin-like domain-containing protein n=1 Tax=Carnegiea gigantea TaxID=171969 RepID=A0A9Q1KFN8_9CARY|nr:hypothetical protein Cgig2_020126 [Carnegiea gigantea]
MNPQYHHPHHTQTPKKRQRIGSSSRLSSVAGSAIDSDDHGGSLPEPRRASSSSSLSSPFLSPPIAGGFNDPSTADVLLRLCSEESDSFDEMEIYLHSSAICRAKYFAALLSDRWSEKDDRNTLRKMNLSVSTNAGSVHTHLMVLQLLYVDDLSIAIQSPSAAISILPVALKLIFEDCVKQCVRFLEAVPWSEEEEAAILNLVPFLSEEESKELLSRVSTLRSNSESCEQMLHNLLLSVKQNHPNMAPVKAFVAKLLREFSSKESARRVLENAFTANLKLVRDSMEEYSSPAFRGDHNETEAIQRLSLHAALTNGKHLLWLVERMIELRVADVAVKEWSEQDAFAADLQWAFRDDAWRNIVPGLPTVMLKCTSKLASAVAAGSILVARQVRMKLVKYWLPVLIVCKDNMSPVLPSHKLIVHSPKTLYLELEETFLRIISTLPMDDAQELLQQCLSFSTRDSEDCPHLITAFNTWFRRASRTPQAT